MVDCFRQDRYIKNESSCISETEEDALILAPDQYQQSLHLCCTAAAERGFKPWLKKEGTGEHR